MTAGQLRDGHMRTAVILLIACASLLLGGPILLSQAQPADPKSNAQASDTFVIIEEVVSVESKTKGEADQAKKTAGQISQNRASQQKERDKVDHDARLYDDSPQSQQMKNDLANYKATCEGKMLYGGDIGRCNAAASSVKPRLDEHNATMTNYFQRVGGYDAQIQRLGADLKAANDRVASLQNYLSWLAAFKAQLLQQVRASCTNTPANATIEELKHGCGNIQFDGARANLPPCSTQLCRTWDKILAARPQRTQEDAIREYKASGPESATPYRSLDRGTVPAPGK